MSIVIFAMLFIGVGMVSTIEPVYLTLVSIHKPVGVCILLLALVRIGVRLRYGTPPLPADLPEPLKLAAHLSHLAVYALMVAMPLLGLAMLSAADYPVIVAGKRLPRTVPIDASLHSLLWNAHRALALCFFALILMHLGAALCHAWVRGMGCSRAWLGAEIDNPPRLTDATSSRTFGSRCLHELLAEVVSACGRPEDASSVLRLGNFGRR